MIRRLPHVDRVGIEERAAALGKRSIKTTAKQQGIRLAVSMLDLTTLEGADTPGKVRHLCAKAVCPAPTMPEIPSVAAVCVYPALVAVATRALQGTGVTTAAVATGFPAGQTSLDVKLRETEDAVAAGADEIDMVISREAFLAGDDARVQEEIVRVKEACGDAHLKVILETAELGSYDHVRHASMLAMEAGADFIKTSTGKAASGATPGVSLVMLEAIRDYADRTGRPVGFKAAGGVSTTQGGAAPARARQGDARRRVADARPLPDRRVVGAQRSADAVRQDRGRPLRPLRGLLEGVGAMAATETPRTSIAWDYAPAPESADHVRLRDSYGLFIGGEFRRPARRPPRADDQPGHRGAARRGRLRRRGRRRAPPSRPRAPPSPSGRRCPGRERGKYLFRIARLIQERARELAVVESIDGGKPIRESRDVDIPLAAAHFFYYAGWADKLRYGVGGRASASRSASSARSCRGTSRC